MGVHPFLKIRFQVFERDKFRCRYCGRGPDDGVKLVVDHIIPKAKKGQDELYNYITSCSDCNAGKQDILLVANQRGQLPTFIRLKEKA
jgi:5-methylcytosine-specific restriction endonuclease McrA